MDARAEGYGNAETGHACEEWVHRAIKTNNTRWELETQNERVWRMDGATLDVRDCCHCGGMITRPLLLRGHW